MTDKQRLIYDLSLQCAALEVQRYPDNTKSLQAEMLDAFVASVRAFSCMDSSSIDFVLRELEKV